MKKVLWLAVVMALFCFLPLVFSQDIVRSDNGEPLQNEEPRLPGQALQQPAQPPIVIPLPTEDTGKISMDVKGMDIVDVLQMIAKKAGMSIVIGKNVNGRVALFFKEVDVKDAFDIVILANDLAYDKTGEIVNVMTQRDYQALYGEAFQDKKQIKSIVLKNVNAGDLVASLTQMKTAIGRVVPDAHSNMITLIDTPTKIREMEDFIVKADISIQTKIFNLRYAQADKLSAKIQEVLTKNVGSVKVDERTNKIAVTDYPSKIEDVEQLVSAFDEKTLQVVIDAQIVEISPQKDQFSVGVDWDYWLKKNFRYAGALPAPSLTDIGAIPNKLSFGVAAAEADVTQPKHFKSVVDFLRVIGKTKILSSPRIMALNNQEAKILVGTKEAFITSTVSQSGTNAITSQSVNFVDVGIKLYVTPTINADGFVTMKIRPEISSSKRTDIVSEGQITQIPIVTTSESETTIMVKDGATIVIAGLKKDKRDKEVQKFPVLGDIPLLGLLFKNTKDEVIQNELVIFLTPRIVTGEGPLEYNSLTKDKDIEAIQAKAWGDQRQSGCDVEFNTLKEYREFVVNKIKDSWDQVVLKEKPVRGCVKVKFVLESDGVFKSEPRLVSSTDRRLNESALLCVKGAVPFPPFPNSVAKDSESFLVILQQD